MGQIVGTLKDWSSKITLWQTAPKTGVETQPALAVQVDEVVPPTPGSAEKLSRPASMELASPEELAEESSPALLPIAPEELTDSLAVLKATEPQEFRTTCRQYDEIKRRQLSDINKTKDASDAAKSFVAAMESLHGKPNHAVHMVRAITLLTARPDIQEWLADESSEPVKEAAAYLNLGEAHTPAHYFWERGKPDLIFQECISNRTANTYTLMQRHEISTPEVRQLLRHAHATQAMARSRGSELLDIVDRAVALASRRPQRDPKSAADVAKILQFDIKKNLFAKPLATAVLAAISQGELVASLS